jgi:hypothetical protein
MITRQTEEGKFINKIEFIQVLVLALHAVPLEDNMESIDQDDPTRGCVAYCSMMRLLFNSPPVHRQLGRLGEIVLKRGSDHFLVQDAICNPF